MAKERKFSLYVLFISINFNKITDQFAKLFKENFEVKQNNLSLKNCCELKKGS